jgi:hypothetical protein
MQRRYNFPTSNDSLFASAELPLRVVRTPTGRTLEYDIMRGVWETLGRLPLSRRRSKSRLSVLFTFVVSRPSTWQAHTVMRRVRPGDVPANLRGKQLPAMRWCDAPSLQ